MSISNSTARKGGVAGFGGSPIWEVFAAHVGLNPLRTRAKDSKRKEFFALHTVAYLIGVTGKWPALRMC